MEGQSSSPAVAKAAPARSEVDTSRPFRSVREAVAVFGERSLVGDRKACSAVTMKLPLCSVPQKPIYSAFSSPPSFSSSSHFNQDREDELMILSTLKKLEAELEETKQELRLLKERESGTAAALASLDAELRKNMSKLAEMEEATKSASGERRGEGIRASFEYLPSLSAVLRLDDKSGGRRKKMAKTLRKKKKKKKKPIVPLIGDIFFNNKVSS